MWLYLLCVVRILLVGVAMGGHFGLLGGDRFNIAHEVVAGRSQVAGVIPLKELTLETGNVHMNRALTGAGFAGKAAVQTVVDFVGIVVAASGFGEAIPHFYW